MIAGTATENALGVSSKPADWTKMYFHDQTAGGAWDANNDIIFINDGNVYYDAGKDTVIAGTGSENLLGAADGESSDWSELSYIDAHPGGLWDASSDTIFDDKDGSGTYGGIARGITVSGNYAYLADGHSGVDIINITTTTSPTLESRFDTGNAQKVLVSGTYMYVADHAGGVEIVDISDPANPAEVGAWGAPEGYAAMDIALSGNYLYVANYGAGVYRIDVTTSSSPTLIASSTTAGSALGIAVDNNNVYVADYAGGLEIHTPQYVFNYTNTVQSLTLDSISQDIVQLDFYATDTVPTSTTLNYQFTVDGGTTWINATSGSRYILDTPGSDLRWRADLSVNYSSYVGTADGPCPRPTPVIDEVSFNKYFYYEATFDTGNAQNVAVLGNYMYVADHAGGMEIVDISDPANPAEVGAWGAPQGYAAMDVAVDQEGSSTYAYLAYYEGGLRKIDVTTSTSPNEVASSTDATSALAVFLDGDYVYVADYNGGIKIFDKATLTLQNPGNDLSASINKARDIYISGHYAYIADETNGARIVDITTTSAPSLTATVSVPNAIGVTVFGDYLYIADCTDGLYVYNISNAASPSLADTYSTSTVEAYYGVAVGDGLAYVANDTKEIEVLDVSDPNNLVYKGSIQTSATSTARGIIYSGGYAFLSDGTAGVRIISPSGVAVPNVNYLTLVSSPFNTGDPKNTLSKISWTETLNSGDVKFQVRTSPDGVNWTPWCGPDNGDANKYATTTYFTDPSGGEAIEHELSDQTNDQWIQYKMYISNTPTNPPVVSDVTMTFIINTPPDFDPDNPVSAIQNPDGSVTINYSVRDTDSVSGTVTPSFQYWNGSAWVNCATTSMDTGDTDAKSVSTSTYTAYTAHWYPKTDFPDHYLASAKIRVIVDDEQPVNNTASQDSPPFELDTKNPVGTISIDGSTQYGGNPSTIHISAVDDTMEPGVKGYMRFSTSTDFTGIAWQTYTTTSTIMLRTSTTTLYWQIEDSYGNTDSGSEEIPAQPQGLMVQDTSNVNLSPPTYNLFTNWGVIDVPPSAAFKHYNIMRATSTDETAFAVVGTTTEGDRSLNYYNDSGVVANQSYYYEVTAEDEHGNISFRSSQVWGIPDGTQDAGEGGGGGDITPPTISNIATSSIYTAQATITWTTDELADEEVDYTPSTSTPDSYTYSQHVASYATSHAVTITNLNPATEYHFIVRSVDPSGNVATSSDHSFITAAGPKISNVSVQSVFNTQATIFWLTDVSADSHVEISTSSDMSGSVTYGSSDLVTTVDSQGYYEHKVTATGLKNNTRYYFYVRSQDSLGQSTIDNNAGSYYTFRTTGDNQPPVVSEVSAVTTAYTATITWTTDELANSEVEYGLTDSYGSVASSSVFTIQHVIRLTGLTEKATYHYRIISDDENGNEIITIDRTFIPVREADHTPPVITSVTTSASTIYTTQATITWTTDELANALVVYSTSSDFSATSSARNNAMVTDHRVVLTGLTPTTTYYYKVYSTDFSDNTAVSDNGYSFTTHPGPVISNVIVSSVENQKATIKWLTDIDSTSTVVYSSSPNMENPMQTTDNTFTTAHAVTLTELSANTIYYFYVKSADSSGNLALDNNAEDNYYFTTANDQIPPVISEVNAVSTVSTVTITWQTDELSTSQVDYGATSNYTSSTVPDNTLTIQHVVTISQDHEFEAGVEYHYRVRSTDANGNLATSTDYTFTFQTKADTTAPTISSVAVASTNVSGATITWTTDEPANSLVGYGASTSTMDSIAGQNNDSTTTHSVTITGLDPDVTYYFYVQSTDGSGNVATDNNSGNYYTFVTEPDTTPPVISNVQTATISDTQATVVWETNELSTSQVEYGDSTSYGNQTTEDSTLTYTHAVTITGLTKETTYHYRVISKDLSNNIAQSSDYTFTTTKKPGGEAAAGGGGGIIFITKTGKPDTTPPQMTNVKVTAKSYTSVTLSWNSNEPADTFVQYGLTTQYEEGVFGKYENTTNHTLELKGLLAATTYHFRALGKDDYGNLGSSADQTFTTLGAEGQVPTEAQVPAQEKSLIAQAAEILNKISSPYSLASISDVLQESAKRVVSPPMIAGTAPLIKPGPDWAEVSWVTDKKSNSIVAYADADNYNPNSADPYIALAGNSEESVINHTVKIEGLKPSTVYHFQVRSKGKIGDWAKSKDATFKTLSLTPKVAGVEFLSIKETQAILKWETALPTKTNIELTNSNTGEVIQLQDPSFLRNHIFTLDKLTPSTNYIVKIVSKDEQGVKSESSLIPFSTSMSKNPPVILNVRVSSALIPGKVERVQSIISWQTDKPSTSRIYYQEGISTAKELPLKTPLDRKMVTSHIVITTNFKPGKVYQFRAESIDTAQHRALSKSYTILTPQPKQSVIDLILKNLEQTFGFLKKLNI